MSYQDDADQTVSLLKTKRYALFWFASLFSNIGTWMQQVAQPWVMLTISHSSFLVGVDSFAMNAPGWVFTIWGGVLADRLDRRRVIILFQSIQFLAIIALVILFATSLLRPWMIILISFIVGTTDSLSMPAFQSIVPSLVNAQEIPQAISLNSIQFNLSRTVGPAIAGVALAAFGALACFGANALSFIPFFLSIFWIYPSHITKKTTDGISPNNLDLRAALKDVLSEAHVRVQLLNAFITTLFCSSLVTFCPVVVKDIIKGEVKEFGTVYTAFGLGCLAGALIIYFFATKIGARSPGVMGALLSLLVIGVSFNHSTPLLMGLMIASGALLTMANTASNSNLQAGAKEHQRGRSASLYQLAFRGGMSLGALSTGALTAQFGISKALFINGTLGVVSHFLILIIQK